MDEITQGTLTRRDVLQMVTALLGGAALAGGERVLAFTFDDDAMAVAVQQGTSLFAATDVAMLDEIAETILPETSTPGAKAAKTGAFMALMVTEAYDARQQQEFRAGLGQVDEACRKAHGVPFMQATPAQRLSVVEALDREQKADGSDLNEVLLRLPASRVAPGEAANEGHVALDEPVAGAFVPFPVRLDQRDEIDVLRHDPAPSRRATVIPSSIQAPSP